MRILLLTPLLAIGCKDDATETGPTGETGEPPVPTDTDTDETDPVVAPPDCGAYVYRGIEYNCDDGNRPNLVDRCDNNVENLSARLACCECSPALCLADPTCPDDVPPTGIDLPTPPPTPIPPPEHSSCMQCHNGTLTGEPIYSGTGISNPHPFGSAAYIDCVSCHGGNGEGGGKADAHVPAPPQWNDANFLLNNGDNYEYFNYRTRAGIDKMDPWPDVRTPDPADVVDPLDYIQFMNPGDTRVISIGRACGASGCHGDEHAKWVSQYPINTQVGFYSATNFTSGIDNQVPGNDTYWNKTGGDFAHRAVQDPTFTAVEEGQIGRVPRLIEYPVYAKYGETGGQNIFENFGINSATVQNEVHNGANAPYFANQVITGSHLEHLIEEVVAGVCGDCHLGSAGANNRYADFRSSGCTSCHMEYSVDGKSRSTDNNVPKNEPFDPDAIAAPERSHVDSHQIRNVAKFLPGGGFVRGISDYACVGCHQGSNRTVLQYWGIRMDQNADVVNQTQYPANPFDFTTTENDSRLYNPAINNETFNGRNFNQHLLMEDYDDDQRDDIPADVHYEAGMGCIDCHGEFDMHGGSPDGPEIGIVSHQSQATFIICESCHGDADTYPATASCVDYYGQTAECAIDRIGNPLRNVTRDPVSGNFMVSLRVLGGQTFVPLTKDTVNSANLVPNPGQIGAFVYSPEASYAMGRLDGNVATGHGPQQTNPLFGEQNSGFSHLDRMDCNSCHASWTNSCIGCHMTGIYDANPANYFFSNITGDRIVINFNADFTYQSPTLDYLTVGTKGKITTGQPGMKMFFRYRDINNVESNVLAFTDRIGNGNNPALLGRGNFGALSHNKIAQHSVRGRLTNNAEGVKYCQACHNVVGDGATTGLDGDFNNDGVTNLEDYITFRDQYEAEDFENLDYDLLQQVIGLNTHNRFGHPIKVAMMAGLGSGLFLFDDAGCPVNPLDNRTDRHYCYDPDVFNQEDPDNTFVPIAPAVKFNNFASFNNVTYDLDYITQADGRANASYSQPVIANITEAFRLRNGANFPDVAGSLGGTLIERLQDPVVGIVLDSWLDHNGQAQGDIALYQQDI